MCQVAEPSGPYGGQWTIDKLDILERYLNAYTTALKNQPFKLMYIDAFAGTGYIELPQDDSDDLKNFIRGSAKRALDVDDKKFDKLIFIEKDPDLCAELKGLKEKHPSRDIQITNTDANEFLRNLQGDWMKQRGVLFLDPFATQVEWSTIETIANFNALDTWILFPISAIARILPKSKQPDDISDKWVTKLTKVYGDESWRGLYHEKAQPDMFKGRELERDRGVEGLLKIYKQKLRNLLGPRFLDESRSLRNSKNSILFEFMLCVGNENGIKPAKRIAKHILKHI